MPTRRWLSKNAAEPIHDLDIPPSQLLLQMLVNRACACPFLLPPQVCFQSTPDAFCRPDIADVVTRKQSVNTFMFRQGSAAFDEQVLPNSGPAKCVDVIKID